MKETGCGEKFWHALPSPTIWHRLDSTYFMLGLQFVFQVRRITYPGREGKVSVRTVNLTEMNLFISYQTRTKYGPCKETNNVV